MPPVSNRRSYNSCSDILYHHGIIVFLLYWFTEFLSCFCIAHWLRRLPREFPNSIAYNKYLGKPTSWWQDLVFLFSVFIGVLAANLAWNHDPVIACLGSWVSAYVLYGALVYHIRVLWFDDLKPGIPNSSRYVGSHRRILFVSFINYALMIYLFPSFYLWDKNLHYLSRSALLQRSFEIATTFSLPRTTVLGDRFLIGISLFFVVIVIATAASISYHRKEHAPRP